MDVIKIKDTQDPGRVGYATQRDNSWYVFYIGLMTPFVLKRKPKGVLCKSSDIPEDILLAMEHFLGY